MTSKGYIHVYTGNGKGKTTAAPGLALQAVGAGKKVFFVQFIKGKPYSETKAVEKFIPAITIKKELRQEKELNFNPENAISIFVKSCFSVLPIPETFPNFLTGGKVQTILDK